MSILSTLKDSFFEEDAKPTPEPAFGAHIKEAVAIIKDWQVPATIPSGTNPMVATLRAKVHPVDGPLVTFMATLQSLAAYISDEASRYHAAQDAHHISSSNLVGAIEGVLGAINAQLLTFNKEKDQNVANQITSREHAVADMTASIDELTKKRDALAVELVQAKTAISSRSEQFMAAVTALVAEYQGQEQKIKTYLEGTK